VNSPHPRRALRRSAAEAQNLHWFHADAPHRRLNKPLPEITMNFIQSARLDDTAYAALVGAIAAVIIVFGVGTLSTQDDAPVVAQTPNVTVASITPAPAH